MKLRQNPSIRLEIEELRQRLHEAEETLNAIRAGDVDALVVSGPAGEKVFTLEGAEHPYRIIVETMNEGAVSLSAAGVILYCNSAFARMVARPLEQIMGNELAEFVPAERRDLLRNLIRQSQEQATRAEMMVVADSGTSIPAQFSLNPVDLEDGPAIGVVITDLSERLRNEEAQAAVRIRDDFLAIAAHELRTPLSALTLRLGLLERHAAKGDSGQVLSSARRAQDQAERIGRLIDRLLDVSQLAGGASKLQLAPCDLGTIVEGVAERMMEEASHAGSELQLSIAHGVNVVGDKLRLEEAIGNIVSNAVKFGGGQPVGIELEGRKSTATLAIHDCGIGIPPEELPHVFGRFERSSNSRNYGGLGLGLYIASEIIRQHGGTIRAENRPTGGTSFTIELPRTKILPE